MVFSPPPPSAFWTCPLETSYLPWFSSVSPHQRVFCRSISTNPMLANVGEQTRTYTHTHQTHMHAHSHICGTHTHACTHACAHTHTHTHTHTHMVQLFVFYFIGLHFLATILHWEKKKNQKNLWISHKEMNKQRTNNKLKLDQHLQTASHLTFHQHSKWNKAIVSLGTHYIHD